MQRFKHVFTRSHVFTANDHVHGYKAPKPAVFTLLDIIELSVQARAQQIIESAIPDFVSATS